MTLQAKDLRVGNLVSITESAHKDDVEQVTSFMLQQIKNGYMVFGIPLNEEKLLNNGFIREGDFLELPIDDDLSIIWVGYLGIMIGGSISFLVDKDKLHELQNLYFALTGQELIFRN